MIKTLKAMGLSDALNAGRADFSGIDGGAGHLYISEVIHRTWVQVDEEGTEAAAATAVVLKLGAAMRKPVEFKADRPFLFAIRDTKSGALLFLGRVADPR
jgi:serpin B